MASLPAIARPPVRAPRRPGPPPGFTLAPGPPPGFTAAPGPPPGAPSATLAAPRDQAAQNPALSPAARRAAIFASDPRAAARARAIAAEPNAPSPAAMTFSAIGGLHGPLGAVENTLQGAGRGVVNMLGSLAGDARYLPANPSLAVMGGFVQHALAPYSTPLPGTAEGIGRFLAVPLAFTDTGGADEAAAALPGLRQLGILGRAALPAVRGALTMPRHPVAGAAGMLGAELLSAGANALAPVLVRRGLGLAPKTLAQTKEFPAAARAVLNEPGVLGWTPEQTVRRALTRAGEHGEKLSAMLAAARDRGVTVPLDPARAAVREDAARMLQGNNIAGARTLHDALQRLSGNIATGESFGEGTDPVTARELKHTIRGMGATLEPRPGVRAPLAHDAYRGLMRAGDAIDTATDQEIPGHAAVNQSIHDLKTTAENARLSTIGRLFAHSMLFGSAPGVLAYYLTEAGGGDEDARIRNAIAAGLTGSLVGTPVGSLALARGLRFVGRAATRGAVDAGGEDMGGAAQTWLKPLRAPEPPVVRAEPAGAATVPAVREGAEPAPAATAPRAPGPPEPARPPASLTAPGRPEPARTPAPRGPASAHTALVRQGGGEYVGEMPRSGGRKPLVLFNDPVTHSTLALPAEDLTPENVAARIADSRAQFHGTAGLGNAPAATAPPRDVPEPNGHPPSPGTKRPQPPRYGLFDEPIIETPRERHLRELHQEVMDSLTDQTQQEAIRKFLNAPPEPEPPFPRITHPRMPARPRVQPGALDSPAPAPRAPEAPAPARPRAPEPPASAGPARSRALRQPGPEGTAARAPEAPPLARAAPRAPEGSVPAFVTSAKPRYGYGSKLFQLEFEDPRAKALYTIAQTTKNATHDRALAWLKQQYPGASEQDLIRMGQEVRAEIKRAAAEANPGRPLRVPGAPRFRAR